MAADFKSRITGVVVHTEKQNFGSGERAFKFLEVSVQTSPKSIVPVRVTDRWEYETPRVGDRVDLEVTISGYSGRNGLDLSAVATGYYDESWLSLQTSLAA
jgi:hypothetical protein